MLGRMSIALLAALAGSATAGTRGMTADDLVRFDRVSEPQLAPDGARLAYVLRETDMEANRGLTALWLQDYAGGKPTRLTSAPGGVSSPRWSPDGRSLYFLSTRSGSNQVWRLDLRGGEAHQVTDYAIDVGNFKLAPDGKSLALSIEVFNDCADLACSKQRLDAKAAEKASGVVFDKLFIRHWDTWADGRRNQLFVAALGADGKAAAEPRKLSTGIDGDISSKPFGDDTEYTWSPDGRSLVFSVRIAGKTEAWSTNFDLFEVPADGSSAPRNLTADNPAWDAGPVFSADGKTLYYRAMKRPGFEADRFALMQRDLKTGKTREIAPQWDASADGIELSADGKRIYTTAYDLGEHRLFTVDIAKGTAQRIVSGGTIGGFSLVGKRLVFQRDTLASPAQLFAADANGGSERQLSDFNAARLGEIAMGSFEQFEFPGWNDETVHGYVMKPWNWQAGGKYPVAFIIHGGPQGSMGNNFHYRWNPQTYAGQGWAVVFIDFHGSTGYGQAFTDSISGDWGGKPLEDLKKGWAAALSKYDFLDGDRACALGASYGGYMINWIAGNWNAPWDCLVTHDGVFDSRMMSYSTEELWFDEWEQGGTAYEKPANFEVHNPVNFVKNWKVPMLVVQGQLDFRIPAEQGIGVFTALQRRGIDSQFLYFPDENHWVLKPHNSVLWHNTVNAWLHRYLDR